MKQKFRGSNILDFIETMTHIDWVIHNFLLIIQLFIIMSQ